MRTVRGFSLVELMIVVAIVAILAAIAIPAYQDHVARAQVAEGFTLASGARLAVASHYAEKTVFPPDNIAAGLAVPQSIIGRYVTAVTVGPSNGNIDVRFGNNASASITGQSLRMQMQNSGGGVHWTCSGLNPKFLPAPCR